MGVDSKGLCVTENKEVLEILSVVEKALNDLIFGEKKKNSKVKGRFDPDYKDVSINLMPSYGMATLNFTIKGEKRNLHFHFSCDSDNEERFPGKKLSWSVGHWGESRLIVETVGEALMPYGPVYIDINDCDDKDYCLLQTDSEAV